MDWYISHTGNNRASVYKGFFHNEWIIFIDVTSLLAGYLIIDQLEFHKNQRLRMRSNKIFEVFVLIYYYIKL